jgi:LPS sulfotransferase NodH
MLAESRQQSDAPNPSATGAIISSQRNFAIIACQRSGTHLLREILNSNPRVAVVEEPMTPNEEPDTWHEFLELLPPEKAVYLDVVEAAKLFDQYMQFVSGCIRRDCREYGGPKQSPVSIGLDIKYNQLRCVNPMYVDLRMRPFLLDYFQQHNFRIVHLVRKNLLQQSISLVLSNLRRVWRNEDREMLPGSFHLPVDEVIGYMYWVRDERAEIERLMRDLDVCPCAYEDIVDDLRGANRRGNIPQKSKAIQNIAEFLQVPNRFHQRDCLPKVINRPYCEIIANYAEIVSAVRESEFAEFTDTI